MTSDNPLNALTNLGQSIWLDFITREILEDGTLKSLIEEDGLRGMTTNPTIFSKAIGDGTQYDADLRAADPDDSDEAVFERLAVRDVQRAADTFRPVHDAANGTDGFVSIECRPTLARDTEGTIREARHLWNACDRPNVMIKIPGTREGLPAIETCLAEGINVNVTLLFSVERYREVVEAWFRAMERRAAAGERLDRVASVASFFVSRVDVLLDRIIDSRDEMKPLRSLFGVANARRAYHAFEELFAGDRWTNLRDQGAQMQRPLWASTSTKDPSLPDTYYVEELIGPHTVNTLPPVTVDAYRDHGEPAVRIRNSREEADAAFRALEGHGVDFTAAMVQLEDEGVEKFTASYEELLATIRSQRAALSTA